MQWVLEHGHVQTTSMAPLSSWPHPGLSCSRAASSAPLRLWLVTSMPAPCKPRAGKTMGSLRGPPGHRAFPRPCPHLSNRPFAGLFSKLVCVIYSLPGPDSYAASGSALSSLDTGQSTEGMSSVCNNPSGRILLFLFVFPRQAQCLVR